MPSYGGRRRSRSSEDYIFVWYVAYIILFIGAGLNWLLAKEIRLLPGLFLVFKAGFQFKTSNASTKLFDLKAACELTFNLLINTYGI